MQIHPHIQSASNEHLRFPSQKPGQAQLVAWGSSTNNQRPRLIYDGICNLCSTAVRFLYAIRGEQIIKYMPYQNLSQDLKRKYGLGGLDLRGRMYLIQEDGALASGSIALAEVCKLLTPFGSICKLFRTAIAQRAYDWVAQRRYRIFGCSQACYVVKSNR